MNNKKVFDLKKFYLVILFITGASRILLLTRINDRIIGVFVYVLTFVFLIFRLYKLDKSNLKSIGLSFENFLEKIFFGLLIATFEILLYMLIFKILIPNFNIEIMTLGRTKPKIFSAILITFYNLFLVAVTEEIIFRGYIFSNLKILTSNKFLVVVVTSLAFSLYHIFNFQIVQLIETFIVSVIYCIILYKFKKVNLVSLIVAHGIFNSFPTWIFFFL